MMDQRQAALDRCIREQAEIREWAEEGQEAWLVHMRLEGWEREKELIEASAI